MLTFAYCVTSLTYLIIISLIIFKKQKTIADLYFLLLIIGIFLWTATLYLYLFADTGGYLLFVGRLNYAAGVLASLGITAFFYYFPWKKFSFSRWVETSFLVYSIVLFFITLFTPMIDAAEMMTFDGPVVTLGKYYCFYAIHLGASILLPVFFGLKKKSFLTGLDKIRFQYSFWVFVPTYTVGYLTATILPIFGIVDHFKFVFLLFIPGIISSFYASIKYRFLDIKLIISKAIRVALAFLLALILPFSVYLFFFTQSPTRLPHFYYVPFVIGVTILIYSGLLKFFNLNTFCKFFGTTATEYFIKMVEELRQKSVIYTSLREFQKDLHRVFVRELHLKFTNIVLLDECNRQNFRQLVKISARKKKALVLKEVQFLRKNSELGRELENLGEVVLPLFQPAGELIGFLVLGKKPFDDVYSKEEIEVLERAQNNFSLKLTGALFNSQLKKEVRRKTESLKKQNERIRELLRQQADFIAVSAHELRTPLSIALLQTEILEEVLESQNESEIKSARDALKRLQNLVQKLFTVQRHDLNKVGLNLQKIKMTDFLDKTTREFVPVFREKSTDFRFENNLPPDFALELDPLQFRQVLQNILSNAVKFTPQNGRVIFCARTEKENILLAIRNSGRAIPDRDKKLIFEKFRSLHSSKGKGLGLGLYLSRKIVELHRGKIWVEDVGDETEFRIQLPTKF